MSNQPSPPIRKSRLINGLVVPPSHLELIAVDHCNLSCRSCNHASPEMPAWFADPATVNKDFSILARHYRPAVIKVIGGEPLLHENLDEVIRAARATGISDHFVLVTNAKLLHKAGNALWNEIDEIQVSIYPGVEQVTEDIPLLQEKACALDKKITIFKYEQFRATFNLRGVEDKELVDKIYTACKIANFWGCHAVRDGYFYKCPQSIYIPMLTGQQAETDRLAITDDEKFSSSLLLEFVNSPTPLHSCANCLGTVGIQEEFKLVPRMLWREHIDRKSEDMVDYDWLRRSLITHDNNDDCNIPIYYKAPGILTRVPLLMRALRSILPAKVFQGFVRQGKRPVRQAVEEIDQSADKS